MLYHMGLVTKMGYGPTASTTSNYNAYSAFKTLGYYDAERLLSMFTDTTKWVNTFYRNISEFKPLFVTGWGHAYICDGYDPDGFFHYNLGWGGRGNGYYPLLGYGSFPSTEAFVEVIPWRRQLPPVNLRFHNDVNPNITWHTHRDAETAVQKYRIYINGERVAETTDSIYFTNELGPGKHLVQVTAVYQEGESAWIGPVSIVNKGEALLIEDEGLRRAINKSLGIKAELRNEYQPREDEFQFVEIIELNEAVSSLSGIEFCQELKILRLPDNDGRSLDLDPLKSIQNLRILELGNLVPINLNSLKQNTWLIKLHLDGIPIDPLGQFSCLEDLISLKISDVPVTEIDSLKQFPLLRTAQLRNCGIKIIESLESLDHIRSLDLSDNDIERISLNHYLPHLRELNLANNTLTQMWFIEKLDRIEVLNLNNNSLGKVQFNQEMPYLKRLEIAGNGLNKVWITRDIPLLEYVDISNNQIDNIDLLIYHAPNISLLKSSNNQLTKMWSAGLQKLSYLDLSNNKLSLIDPVSRNPVLKHFDVSGNLVGDFYPLNHNDLYVQLEYLNLQDNPASLESYDDFYPLFKSKVDTFLQTEMFEPVVPCYPSPFRNTFIHEKEVNLSWSVGSENHDLFYDIFFGVEGHLDTIARALRDHHIMVDIVPNESYKWQVLAYNTDTSFLSGLFDFQTYMPIKLPYNEGFESFPSYGFLATESPYWRTNTNSPGSKDDAQVIDYKSLEGNKSLRMISNSHLGLSINQFKGSRLLIRFGMYIENNSRAAIKITNLNGADLAIFLKVNGKGDVVYNGKLIEQFFYVSHRWMEWNIFISGHNKAMDIRMDGNLIVDEELAFAQQQISFDKLEFSTEEGPFWPTDGFPLFYLDDLYISGYGSAGTDNSEIPGDPSLPDFTLYPNPVSDILHIRANSHEQIRYIDIYSSMGQLIRQDIPGSSGNGDIEINIDALPPGNYWVLLRTISGQKSYRIIITGK